ncbi:MAG: YraN family protein [Bdellovibrionales bacterium]
MGIKNSKSTTAMGANYVGERDLRAAPVAAASIVAKVERDQLLDRLAEKYPEYGFNQHKVTELSSIKKRFKLWARVRNIELHLPEYGSTSSQNHWEKWAESWLIANRCELLGRNVRLPFAEVDLIIFKNKQLHLIEVKSRGIDAHFLPRVSLFQRDRLERCVQFLSHSLQVCVRAHLITFDKNKKPVCFVDFLAD